MATPTLVTVLGDIAPVLAAKLVTFRIPTVVRYNAGPDVIVPSTIIASVAADGTFTTQVYATNDPAWSPANWNYLVTIDGDNLHEQYYVQVPYTSTTINFSDLIPAQVASLGTLYAAYSHGNHVMVLGLADPVPPGTPVNTVIVRKAT
jgi:hypothetical protein